MGDKPTHRLIKRKEDGTGWETIGAAWEREASKGGYSVNLELVRGGPKIKCLLVKNEERPTGQTAAPPASSPTPDFAGTGEIPF